MPSETLRFLMSPIAGITSLAGEALQQTGGLAGEALDEVNIFDDKNKPADSGRPPSPGLQPPSTSSPSVQSAAAEQRNAFKKQRRRSTLLTSFTNKQDRELLGIGAGKAKLGV